MPKTKVETQLLKEFRKLSSQGKGEVFQYAKWMRDVESMERAKEFKDKKIKALDNSRAFLIADDYD